MAARRSVIAGVVLVAYRVNLASAVFGASAVGALYFVGLRLGGGIVAALAGAAAFGTSPLFWSQGAKP